MGKETEVVLEIGNVRVTKQNSNSYQLDEFRAVLGKEGEKRKDWMFVGWYATIQKAIVYGILDKGLLLDMDDLGTAEKLAEQLEQIKETILESTKHLDK